MCAEYNNTLTLTGKSRSHITQKAAVFQELEHKHDQEKIWKNIDTSLNFGWAFHFSSFVTNVLLGEANIMKIQQNIHA